MCAFAPLAHASSIPSDGRVYVDKAPAFPNPNWVRRIGNRVARKGPASGNRAGLSPETAAGPRLSPAGRKNDSHKETKRQRREPGAACDSAPNAAVKRSAPAPIKIAAPVRAEFMSVSPLRR